MDTIKVWAGYRSHSETFVTQVVFAGEFIGGLHQRENWCDIERAVYRADDGRVVVHEVRRVQWGALETLHSDESALVYVFGDLDEVRESLGISWLDPHRRSTASTRFESARTVTLEEYLMDFETYDR